MELLLVLLLYLKLVLNKCAHVSSLTRGPMCAGTMDTHIPARMSHFTYKGCTIKQIWRTRRKRVRPADGSPALGVEGDSSGRRLDCARHSRAGRCLLGLWRGRSKLRGHLRPTHLEGPEDGGACICSPDNRRVQPVPPCPQAPTTLPFLPSATQSCNSFNFHCLWGKGN